ncbi:hypothetical protein HBA55_33665 [Pseudomaricurvus alkylphenolicus]|uniref:ATP-binding protein n=1 Tax=Pseudomaricurvus alkylphenolicus TaxID=1306991 RepID=UPI00141FCB9D|nr:ATP-binding protein [Pseudomaricurvus alkylphenolicus]NIB44585.1 hypothetical protein [Pseudomaricurvus alkylphenolicus]
MRSIFFRVYIGIVLAVIAVGTSALLGYRYWQAERLDQYLLQQSRGTIQLIFEGMQRHRGERQDQWKELSQRVTGLDFELVPKDLTVQLKTTRWGPLQLHLARLGDDKRLVLAQLDGVSDQWLRFVLSERKVSEQFFRGTTLLLLNELGRLPKQSRQQALREMQDQFGFVLRWLSRDQLAAGYVQNRALSRGDTVVELTTLDNGDRAIRTLAPIGNSGEFLQLGDAPLYVPFPRAWLVALIILSLLLLAGLCFLLIRPLERRLNRMMDEVRALQPGVDTTHLTVEGRDTLTAVAGSINTMSERIGQLLKAQRDLNHAVSHELKTPLSRCRFHLELADQKLTSAGNDGDNPARKHLRGISDNLGELNSLVEEILLYASLESHRPDLQLRQFPLAPALELLLVPLVEQNPNLKVQRHLEPGLMIDADSHYIKRALQNLLNNAFQYAETTVAVTAASFEGKVIVRIGDDGPGIPESHRESVLEPFTRVESSRSRRTGGTGLGLAIVRQIAHWHGGEVSIGQSKMGGAEASLEFVCRGTAPADTDSYSIQTDTH